MKTKTIPFDLETAKKIQSGEIRGHIKDAEKFFVGEIVTFNGSNTPLPICVKFKFPDEDRIFFVGNDGVSTRIKLVLEVQCDESQFEPFEKVLCRDDDDDIWKANLFSHKAPGLSYPYYVCGGNYYKQCIAYDGNEQLVGTTNKPKNEHRQNI